MKNSRKKKALILSALASLAILSGCGSKTKEENKTIKIDGVEYIQRGDEYEKLEIPSKVFEPGEHTIAYVIYKKNGSINFTSGWNSIYEWGIETPEGYEFVCLTSGSEWNGNTDVLIYTYVNTKTVEVEGTYNEYDNCFEFSTPGKVIEEKTLEMGD